MAKQSVASQATGTLPARRSYKPALAVTPMTELPFVRRQRRDQTNHWHVPPAQSYRQAFDIGLEYAAHFVQYLQDNPTDMNELSWILEDIDFHDDKPAKGYYAGFTWYLNRIIQHAARVNAFADVDEVRARYAEAMAARNSKRRAVQ